jgi:ABC-type amino acid transport substrate-binding protein
MQRSGLTALLLTAAVIVQYAFSHAVTAQAALEIRDFEAIKASGAIRVGADPTAGLPYVTYKNDQWAGFEVDIAQALGRHMKLAVTLVDVPWRELQHAVIEGKVDLACNALEVRQAEGIRFSKPYYTASQAIITAKKTVGIYGVQDLSKRKVAVTTGSVAAAIVSRLRPPAFMIPQRDTVAPLQAIVEKRAEAAVLESAMAHAWLRNHTKEFQVVGRPMLPKGYGIAMRGGDGELHKAVEQAIQGMKRSGEQEKILRDHHVWDVLQGSAKAIVPASGPLPSLPPRSR